MRVVTFNLWARQGAWRVRHAVVADQLGLLGVDLLCLQEVVAWDDVLSLAERLGLRVLLADPEGSHVALLGRLPVRASTLLTCRERSLVDTHPRRHALVELSGGGTVVCTHLSWRQEDAAVRRAQLQQLIEALPGGPALVCGDLNCTLDAPELAPLWQAGFEDALTGTPAARRCTWDAANPCTAPYIAVYPSQRIDHVLTNASWRSRWSVASTAMVLDRAVDGVWPSDHCGVRVELVTRPQGATRSQRPV